MVRLQIQWVQASIYGNSVTARRLNIHEHGGDALKTWSDSIIEDSWIHHLGTNVGAHADGEQVRGGGGLIFRRNFCDMPINPSSNNPSCRGPGAPYKSNACLIIQASNGPIDDILVENNWLNGGNYTVYFSAHAGDGFSYTLSNARLLNNIFSDGYRYGTYTSGGAGEVVNTTVSGNVWENGDLM
jgi:hypothetical protein